jgi:hypothetical protein
MAFQGDEHAQAITEFNLALEEQAIEIAIEESEKSALKEQVARDADAARSLQADPWPVVDDVVHPDVQDVLDQVAAYERSCREQDVLDQVAAYERSCREQADFDFAKALALQNQQFPPFRKGYEENEGKEEKEGKAGEEDDFANQCAIIAVAKVTERSRLEVLNDLLGLGDKLINAQILAGDTIDWRAIGMLARKYNICIAIWFDLGGAYYIHREWNFGEGVQTFYINVNLSGVTLADMKREWPPSAALHFEYLTPPGTDHGNPGTREVFIDTLQREYPWCKILNYA